MKEIKAVNKYNNLKGIKIFLCGSIEMGKAENWQQFVVRKLSNFDVIILNPRRDDWDSSWIQSIDNKQFREQVEWELKSQEDADIIIVNFDENTQSPITLLELGLFHNKKMLVSCPKKYFRRGNVEIVCNRYNIPFFENIQDLLDQCIKEIKILSNQKENNKKLFEYEDFVKHELNEKSESVVQQKLFGMAYAVRTGKLSRDKVSDEVLKIVDSDMTDEQIRDFAKTSHEDLPYKKDD